MEFGAYQVQIFVSVALILAAALIALICDYLKGHNQRLRELAVELTARCEESQKLVQLLASPLRSSTHNPATAQQETFSSPFTYATEPEHERDLSRAAAPAVWEEAFSPEAGTMVTDRKRISPEAMVAMLAAARQAIKTGVPGAMVPAEAHQPSPVDAISDGNAPAQDLVVVKSVPGKRDWNALLAAHRRPSSQPPESVTPEPVPEASGLLDTVAATAEPRAAALEWPSGLQSASTWNRLLDSGRKVNGLVVSICVTSFSPSEAAADFPAGVHSAIESMLEAGEFAAPIGANEFVLFCPGVRDATAQRRLSRISQHLWDVQLGSLGRTEPQYTWGGLEVRDESIKDALEAAGQRLQEARHARNLMTHAAHAAPGFQLRETL
jgi:hypothetical protein